MKNAIFAVFLLFLSACSGLDGFQHRYGPDPQISPLVVDASITRQDQIMKRLYEAARCREDAGETGECLYAMTVAGFNFVDEQCDAYLHELFVLDKERDRLKSGILAADKLTNAVLAVSPASKVTMAIVAQAFGLTSEFVDVATDSYLYKANSGTVLHIVAELQSEYRDITFKNRNLIATIPNSYGQIRSYLRLCMPPTIESKIETALAKTTAVPSKSTTPSKEKRESVGATTQGPGSMKNVELETQ